MGLSVKALTVRDGFIFPRTVWALLSNLFLKEATTQQEREHRDHQEDDEQNFRDPGCGSRNASETKNGGD
jgi:hypothetical protein